MSVICVLVTSATPQHCTAEGLSRGGGLHPEVRSERPVEPDR